MSEERYKMPVSVQLILKKGNEVLLLKRKNTGFADGKYALIGGHVEKNEEIRKAMIREAKEEAGIIIKEEDLKLKHIMNRKVGENNTYIDFILEAEKWEGIPNIKEPNKSEDMIWVNKNQLPENIIDFEKQILEENKEIYIPWGWENK